MVLQFSKATESAKIDAVVALHFLIRIAVPSGNACDRIYSNDVGRRLEKDLTLNWIDLWMCAELGGGGVEWANVFVAKRVKYWIENYLMPLYKIIRL